MLATLVFIFETDLRAEIRSSANYAVIAEHISAGGGRSESTNYVNIGSIETPSAGVSSSGGTQNKAGYVAQLIDIKVLHLTAMPGTIDESGMSQVSATLEYDDGSTYEGGPSDYAWAIDSGPFSSISSGGQLTAPNIYRSHGGYAISTYGLLPL